MTFDNELSAFEVTGMSDCTNVVHVLLHTCMYIRLISHSAKPAVGQH